MIRLDPPVRDHLADYMAVANAREDPARSTLQTFAPTIKKSYTHYKNQSKVPTFNQLKTCVTNSTVKEILRESYNTQLACVKRIENGIRDAQKGIAKTTCQYCGVNTPSTLDHFAPRAEFPEFSLLATNLVPCCPRCNNKKKKWLIGGECSAINFYFDSFIQKPFLFAKIVMRKGASEITCNFWLSFKAGFRNEEQKVVRNHFNELGLLELYEDKVASEAGEILCHLKTRGFKCFDHLVAAECAEYARALEGIAGVNYWRAVFMKALSEVSDKRLRQIIYARYLR